LQVVLTLTERIRDLEAFVKSRLRPHEFGLLLKILHKVCESEFDKNKALVINQACNPDLLGRFPSMLVEAGLTKDGGRTFKEVVSDMVHFFSTLVVLLPITAARLKATMQSCLSCVEGISTQGTSTLSKELIAEFEGVLKDVEALQLNTPKVASWQDRKKEQVDKMKFEQPPEDFRSISIFPTIEDVLSTKVPFLRPNVIEGPFFDVEHYLDTHFRLLREDFVRPLRNGVHDLINNRNTRKCESLSVRVYQNVKFLEPVREMDKKNTSRVLNEGVLLCFNTKSSSVYSPKIDWECSKKFMHGSLVCFTSNNFKTLLVATISSRDLKYLKRNQILVTFCHSLEENIFDRNASYTMIESEVFFDPYCQVRKNKFTTDHLFQNILNKIAKISTL